MKRNGTRHKGNMPGKRKDVGVNTIEIAALNKRGPVGEGLELLRGTKERQSTTKATAAQNKTKPLGEGLEPVCGIEGSQSEDRETAAQDNTKPLEKAWN